MNTTMIDNWLIAVIILPVFAAFFKTEIGNILTAWNIYRLRAFDRDGNPATSERVQILCDASGDWVDAVIMKYWFTLSAKKRGVYLRYPDGGLEKLSFGVWAGLRKRVPPAKM